MRVACSDIMLLRSSSSSVACVRPEQPRTGRRWRRDLVVARGHSNNLLAVVGGGAAGYFGAIAAKSRNPDLDCLILEQAKVLEKVRISGGGRCNVTNVVSEAPVLARHYPRGHKELRGAFFREFGPLDVREWFEKRGVELKIEKDGRIFPVSDSSETVIDCLKTEAGKLGIRVHESSRVKEIACSDASFTVSTKGSKGRGYEVIDDVRYLLLASGSSKEGWAMAKGMGHNVFDPRPSLFSFKCADPALQSLAGISLQKAAGVLRVGNRKFENEGPVLITHWGLSGPLVLRLSAWAALELSESAYSGTLYLDLLPSTSAGDLENDLLRMKKLKNKVSQTPTSIAGVLPRRLWRYLLTTVSLDEDKLYCECKDSSIRCLAQACKRLEIPVSGKGPFKEEFVTAGGVDLREVNMKSMESKLRPNLFFAGEVLNVDGLTGGFNFQNAWTGGYLAGCRIAELSSMSS